MFQRVCLICGTQHKGETQAQADEKAKKCGGGKKPTYRYGGYETFSVGGQVVCTLISRQTQLDNHQHVAGYVAAVHGGTAKWRSQKEITQIVRAVNKNK
jgi:hypothetical protein